MTKLFERAVQTVRKLPPEMQDEIGRLVLQIAGDEGGAPIHISAEEEASFDESFAQAEKGDFATNEEVAAIWAKHSL
jgi:hypothetical protein